MNLRTLILVILLIVTFVFTNYSGVSCAAERQAVQFEMENYYYNYSELNLPIIANRQLKSDEYGYVPGFKISYLYQNLEYGSDYRLSLSIANTSLNYDGTDQTGIPMTGTSTATFMDAQVLANLYYFQSIELATYAGIGYHKWDRGVYNPPGDNKFVENYSWGYIPVGVRREFMLTNELSIEPDVSYRFMFAGQISIPYYNANWNLGNKFGVNFQAPIQYRFDESFSGLITPWIDYSEIGASGNIVPYEPSSRTWQYGANIGVRLNF
ncbi:MAG: hypothetical protein WCP79_06510 [Bacillota bacterium]